MERVKKEYDERQRKKKEKEESEKAKDKDKGKDKESSDDKTKEGDEKKDEDEKPKSPSNETPVWHPIANDFVDANIHAGSQRGGRASRVRVAQVSPPPFPLVKALTHHGY